MDFPAREGEFESIGKARLFVLASQKRTLSLLGLLTFLTDTYLLSAMDGKAQWVLRKHYAKVYLLTYLSTLRLAYICAYLVVCWFVC